MEGARDVTTRTSPTGSRCGVVYHTVLPRLLRLDRLGDERQHVDAPEKDVLA